MGNSKSSSGSTSRREREAVQELTSMGFNELQAVSALQSTNGNLEQALNFLLSGTQTFILKP
jgi:hypothetical protein